jgi:hypothetical protein
VERKMARYTIETSSVQKNINLPEFQLMIEKYMTRKICILKIHKILSKNSKILMFINTDLSSENLLSILSEVKRQGKITDAVLHSSWLQKAEGINLSVFSPEELDPIYGATPLPTVSSPEYRYGMGQKILSLVSFAWLLMFIYFMISTGRALPIAMGVVFFVSLIYALVNFPESVKCSNDEIIFYYNFRSERRIGWNDIFELKVLIARGGEYCTILASRDEKVRLPLSFEDSAANQMLRTIIHEAELSYFDDKNFQKPKIIGSV